MIRYTAISGSSMISSPRWRGEPPMTGLRRQISRAKPPYAGFSTAGVFQRLWPWQEPPKSNISLAMRSRKPPQIKGCWKLFEQGAPCGFGVEQDFFAAVSGAAHFRFVLRGSMDRGVAANLDTHAPHTYF